MMEYICTLSEVTEIDAKQNFFRTHVFPIHPISYILVHGEINYLTYLESTNDFEIRIWMVNNTQHYNYEKQDDGRIV